MQNLHVISVDADAHTDVEFFGVDHLCDDVNPVRLITTSCYINIGDKSYIFAVVLTCLSLCARLSIVLTDWDRQTASHEKKNVHN